MRDVMTGNYQHWSLSFDDKGVVWLYFDRNDSKANSLNESTLREFDQILNSLKENKQIKALIIRSNKPTGFIVGADISQFKALKDANEATTLIREGQAIFDKLEALPFLTIALIEGFCLGGGLELALACQYRIAENSPKTRLGLPEVKLGIHPGWGGTIRLPKLIGPLKAMQAILTGKTYAANAAKRLGIIHEAVPKRLLEKAAMDVVNKGVKKPGYKIETALNAPLCRPLVGKLLVSQLRKKANPEHYPSPFAVINNWVKYGVDSQKAMLEEAQSIGRLLVSDTSKNLVRIFFLQEQLKASAKGIDFSPKHIHVVGAGVMGGDIAALCAVRGLKVTLQDKAPKLIASTFKRTYELARKILKEKHLVQAAMDRLLPDLHGEGVATADVIIEAITENLEAKQGLFKELEARAKPSAVLATNTSTIPLEEISTALRDPFRLVGIHFFNPVAKMPLIEVVVGTDTTRDVVQKAMVFSRKIDKLPLEVKSAPGFLVNRILLPYMLEAVSLLEEGVKAPLIDKAAVDFGMPLGPIELADVVGLDICMAALEKLSAETGTALPKRLVELVEKGDLGRKTGKGFYQYQKGKTIKPSLEKGETIPKDIKDRLVLRILNEAVACLREGIVENADLLDAGCIFGFGFPPFRGGPITYARSQGEEQLLTLLDELSSRYGDRFNADKGWDSGAVA